MNNFNDINKSHFYQWYTKNQYNLNTTVNKIKTVAEAKQILREMPRLGLDQRDLLTNRAIKGTKERLTLEELQLNVSRRIYNRIEEIKGQKPIIALSFDYTAIFNRIKRNGNTDDDHPITYNGHYAIDIMPEDNSSVQQTIKRYLQKNSTTNSHAFSNMLDKYNNMNHDIINNYFSGHGGLSFDPWPELKKISNIKYKVWKQVNPNKLPDISNDSDTIKEYGSHKIYMKGEVYTIDGFNIDTVSLQSTGFCVPDYLIHRYGHVKGFIKHCKNRQTMADYFGYESVEDLHQVGVSTEQLVEFARDHRINLRAFDINLNPISILSEFHSDGNRKPLVYIQVFEHLLGVEQGSELYKHLNHRYTASKIKAPQSKVKKDEYFNAWTLPIQQMLNVDPREILEEKDCLVLTNHLNQLLDYLLVEKKVIPFKNNIAFEGTHVVQIKIPNQNLYIFEAGSHKADKELYDKLELVYEGKGKSGLVKAIFNQKHKQDPNKEPIPEENRKTVLANGECIFCGSTDKLTVDHIKPRKLGGTNELDNLQCLCLSCNSSKKAEYNRFDEIQSDLLTEELENIFTKYAHNEKFYLTQKINKRTVSLDINRSYPAGLTENTEPWCRFDATCQPVPVKKFHKDQYGLYYIRFNDNLEEAQMFFRCTDGWFYRHTVEQIMKWGFSIDIFYYLAPSETIKPDYFKTFIHELFDLYDVDDAKNLARVFTGVLRQWKSTVTSKKHFIGSRLGCLTEAHKWNQNGKTPFIRNLTDKLFMIFDMHQQVNPINCLPIAHQMLENSMMNLYNVYHTLQLKPSDIFMVNVDEIVFKKYRNIQSVSVRGRKSVECDTFRQVNLTEILKNNKPFGGYKIKESVNLKRFTQDGEIVPTPVDTESRELYYYQPKKWKLIALDEVNPEYVQENNLCIDGKAGSGKSTLGRKLNENSKTIRLAFTNMASLNIDGKTFHKFFGLNNRNKIRSDWKNMKNIKNVMIDEFSMVPYMIWRILLILKKNNPEMKILMLGDWDQIPPVESRKVEYTNLDFIKELVDCNMLKLTENKRSDSTMWNIFNQLLDTGKIDINQFGKNTDTLIHLVYTNKKRMSINKECNTRHYNQIKPSQFIKIVRNHKIESKQDMIIFPGVPLIATKTWEINKEHIVNNETFVVNSIDGENITIGNEAHQFTFNQNDLYYNFLLAYATTVHKMQGQTINEPYCIHQWGLMDTRLKYTALSRTTCKEFVNIVWD